MVIGQLTAFEARLFYKEVLSQKRCGMGKRGVPPPNPFFLFLLLLLWSFKWDERLVRTVAELENCCWPTSQLRQEELRDAANVSWPARTESHAKSHKDSVNEPRYARLISLSRPD